MNWFTVYAIITLLDGTLFYSPVVKIKGSGNCINVEYTYNQISRGHLDVEYWCDTRGLGRKGRYK